MAVTTKFCEKCKKTMNVKEFYKSNDYVKYPDGYLNQCKKCLTMHVDNWNPDTFLWILKEMDIPYIPEKWNGLLAKYGRDRSQVSGMTIIGRYAAAVKIKPYSDYRWKDTEYLQEQADHKTREAMKRQGYSAAEIDEVIQTGRMVIPENPIEYITEEKETEFESIGGYEDYFSRNEPEEPELDLTDEDKVMLRLKWGKSYRPEEWVQLEQLFQDMMNSYDITAAGDINSLKMMCKASLKANQLLDIGDIDGAQKMTKVYDGLMKSGKWTAAQNKQEGNEIVDSIGELVSLCEKDGFIERYYIDSPSDKADKVIMDNQKYLFELVNGESALGNLIENAIKGIENEKQMIVTAGEEAEHMNDEDALFDYDNKPILSDDDFVDFEDFKDEESLFDDDIWEVD